MTTASIEQLPLRSAEKRARASSSTLEWLKSHAWGLFDQVLISASNFITMVLAARALNPDSAAFGEFSLVYTAMLFVNILQSTLITQPHNVLASSRKGEAYNRYTSATAICQILMVLAIGALALLVAGVGFLAHWHFAPLVLALAPAIVAWQLQEFVRRVLYTEGRLAAAFINDIISYGGQALVIVLLYFTHALTATSAFYGIAITSAVASGLGLYQIRRSLTRSLDLSALLENWHFGKWLAGAEILQWCSSLHMYLYIAAILLGTRASGELKAAQILFGPARVFAFFLCAVLPIRLAKAHHAGGNAALHNNFKSAAFTIAPIMGAYCLFVAILGEKLLELLFNNAFAGGRVLLLLYSLATFLSYLELFVSAALSATRRTRTIFMGYVCGGIIAFLASWPIIATGGVAGAVLCLIVTAITVNVIFWRTYRRKIATAQEKPLQAQALADPACGFAETPVLPGSAEILRNVLATLENDNVPYCFPHGYRNYPDNIAGDVDLQVPAWALPGFAQHLRTYKRQIGAELIQHLDDASPLLILSGTTDQSQPTWLQLHLSSGFTLNHLRFFSDDEILSSRRLVGELWVPAQHVEFACILLNRSVKNCLKDQHVSDLLELYLHAPEACRAQIARFWDATDAGFIIDCIERSDFDALRANLHRLGASALVRRFLTQPVSATNAFAASLRRRAKRFLCPTFGLHIVFLGPDGVGKSTVIENVSRDLAPAFLKSGYQTFAPSILPLKLQPKKSLPHELPPRSFVASILKACWWLVCYTIGYLFTVQTVRGRAGVVLCHRYLIDAIVDPRRYRYGGPIWLLKAIWKIAPKPDLVILLDAPAEVIQARKQEVPFEETARQREGFRAMVEPLTIGRIVDASQPLEKTVADVNQIIITHLRMRSTRNAAGGRP